MGISNRDDADNQLRALRRADQGGAPASPAGYQNRAGATVSNTGNDKAQYVWNAPFQDPMEPWVAGYELDNIIHAFPSVNAQGGLSWGTALPALDVSDYRVITVLLDIQLPAPDEQLRILPIVKYELLSEVATQPGNRFDFWSPIGFVNGDPTLIEQRVTDASGDSSNDSLTAIERTAAPLQLVTAPAGVFINAVPRVRMSLDFEVSSHQEFTLSIIRVPGIPENPTLQAYYTRRM